MSEVTTGSVALPITEIPMAVGAACINAAEYAAKYCAEKHQAMLDDILKTDNRLKWLDKQQISSPAQIATETKKLQYMVSNNPVFRQMTNGITVSEKQLLATAIAIENSPLKSYFPKYLSDIEHCKISLDKALSTSTMDMAQAQFDKISTVVHDAAIATGFDTKVQVITKAKNILDIVFKDNQGRYFTAIIKLNKQLNTTLALDLEGFACDSNACTDKMNDIIKYLNEHGVPFNHRRLKHNQPSGVLRKLIQKQKKSYQQDNLLNHLKEMENYLTDKNDNYLTANKER